MLNWDTGYDASGRPIEVAEAREVTKPFDSIPCRPYGAPQLAPDVVQSAERPGAIPAQNGPVNLTGDKDWTPQSKQSRQTPSGLGWNLGYFANVEPPKVLPFGRLIAWDPVQQQPSMEAR